MSLRMQKINSQIQKMLSEIFNQYSENIIFPMINLVDTAKDLSKARVFVSFAANDQKKEFKKLSRYFGQIQGSFAQSANFKKTPHLVFILDTKHEDINKVEEILENISKSN